MADLFWPTVLTPNASELTITDGAGRFVSPLTGVTRTVSRPGSERLKLQLSFHALQTQKRAAMQSFIAGMRGGVNRVWCHDHSYTKRGSFPATELFTNNTFASGTTGWTQDAATLTVADRVLRVAATSGSTSNVDAYQVTANLTQYAPYVVRAFRVDGKDSAGQDIGPFFEGNLYGVEGYSTSAGMLSAAGVAYTTSGTSGIWANGSGRAVGTFFESPYMSVSRCALVDNAPNLLRGSQTMGTDASPVVWTGTRASVTPNPSPGAVAPDGTSTADEIVEDGTASNSHLLYQLVTVPAASADYSFSVSLKAGARGFARVFIEEESTYHSVLIDVNLSSGATGTATASGAGWTNPRAFVVSQGNGWYRVTIVGRKASASTALAAYIAVCDSLGNTDYNGNSSSSIYAWGASLAQSSVPVKYTATTTAAVAAAAQTGSALNIKGLPASTSGLLLPGDQVQVGNELKFVTASLDSDAAGLGYLQFSPALRDSPADSAPVIIHEPMGKFMLAESENGWSSAPGVFSSADISLVEAAD